MNAFAQVHIATVVYGYFAALTVAPIVRDFGIAIGVSSASSESALAASESLTFTELKAITETTDGNLSVHSRKLEDAGHVTCTKGFDGRMPRTEFALTAAGKRALQKYLDHMEAIISHARRKAR